MLKKLIAHFKNAAGITVNGKNFSGKSIIVTIDGVDEMRIDGNTPLYITLVGDALSVQANAGDITVQGNVSGPVSSSAGDIECGDVIGNVTSTAGDIVCKSISGRASTIAGRISIK